MARCFLASSPRFHQPLDGPFPPGTWPCSPKAGKLDDPDLARSLAAARKRPPVALELKYPDDDPAVKRACELMQQQVAALKAGVSLTLKPVPPDDLRQQVEVVNDYQLAYAHYDYPDEWFHPGGLLDPHARGLGNRNYLNYTPPPEFDGLLAACQNRRDFGALRQAMQQLHAEFTGKE